MAAVTGDSRVIQTQFEHPRLTRPAPEEAGALVPWCCSACVLLAGSRTGFLGAARPRFSRVPTESRIATSLPWLPLPPLKTLAPLWSQMPGRDHEVGTFHQPSTQTHRACVSQE